MAATKEQERKALEKIRKIVEELGGADSYIGMAFEGCFEIAEENIENDFGCSMKQRAEKAQKDADYFRQTANQLSEELEKAQESISTLNKELEAAQKARLTIEDFDACIALARAAATESKGKADQQAEIIVEFADTPDCPAFTEAVRKNRAYSREAARAEQLVSNLNYYMGN